MIDSAGDIIALITASIAAGSGISAWRLLRRLHNLEEEIHGLQLGNLRTENRIKEYDRKFSDQAIFNQVVEERLDDLGDKPAPKQAGRLGTPRPNTAGGFLYGRTRKGP